MNSMMRRSRKSGYLSGSESDSKLLLNGLESAGSLYKFARKLSQRDKSKDNNRHRSVSLDSGDGRTLKIISTDEHPQQQQQHHQHQQQQQRQLESMEVMPSMTASPSAPAFLAKDAARRKGTTNDVDGSNSKSEKRKNDKEKRVVYDTYALFEAVEQQDLDAVKAILDSNSVDLNSLNSENLSALDIALMTNNIPMAKMLLLQGARESPMFQHSGCRTQKLDSLVSEAEKRVVDLTAVVLNGTSGNVNMSPTQLKCRYLSCQCECQGIVCPKHSIKDLMDSKFNFLPRIINGGIAGIVGVTCVFPIDLVKTRLQNQQPGPGGKLYYSSLPDCALKTFRNEGFFGMYKGSGVNLLLITPEKAIKLVGNDFFRHMLCTKSGQLTLPREILSGAGAGMCQIIITTPMELLKIQMQDAGRSARVDQTVVGEAVASGIKNAKPAVKMSATTIALNLIRERGIMGLYQGCGATAMRDITFSAIYFPLFANLNKLGKRREGSEQAVFYHSFISGCLAGCTASFLVNPIDVVKTRLQTLTKGAGEQHYNGIFHCFKTVMVQEGPKAFLKGALCRILVIAPLFGIAQTVYYLGVAEFLLGVKKP